MDPVRRPLIALALTLGAFLVVAAAIRSQVPWAETDGLRAKMEILEERGDTYDALYLGSSHVYHAFRPDVIDPLLSSPGEPFRSLNLGMEGMFSFETDAVLREVLARRPARLRWIFIEAPSWRPKLSKAGANVVTERNARWHSPSRTLSALRSVASSEAPLAERAELAATHLGLLGLWLGNHGQGPSIWASRSGGESAEARARKERLVRSGGYEALEDREGELYRLRQANFLRKAPAYAERVAKLTRQLRKRTEETGAPEGYNLAALRVQRDAVIEAGFVPVYVVMPALLAPRYFDALQREGHMPLLVDLRDPDRFPELYAVEHRFDEGHLTQIGAAIFSRRFVEEIRRLDLPDGNDGA